MVKLLSFAGGLLAGVLIAAAFTLVSSDTNYENKSSEKDKNKIDPVSVLKENTKLKTDLDKANKLLADSLKQITVKEEEFVDLNESLKRLKVSIDQIKEENQKLKDKFEEDPTKLTPKKVKEIANKVANAMVKLRQLRKKHPESDDDAPKEIKDQRSMLFMEMMSALKELKIPMNNAMALYEKPEGREFLSDTVSSMFSELGVPLNESQSENIISLVNKIGSDVAWVNDNSLTKIDKKVKELGVQVNLFDGIDKVLNDDQKSKFYNELGGQDIYFFGGHGRSSGKRVTTEGDRTAAAQAVLKNWGESLKLNDSDKNSLQPLAEKFVEEYSGLKSQIEQNLQKDFATVYFDKSVKNLSDDEQKKELKRRQEFKEKTPDYGTKSSAVDIQFLELQSKFQTQLKSSLPAEKQDSIKKMDPVRYSFPDLN